MKKKPGQQKFCLLFKAVVCFVLISFSSSLIVFPQKSYAQSLVPMTSIAGITLPAPGAMISTTEQFSPLIIRGVTVYPQEPLRFDFIIDTGDHNLKGAEFEEESTRLVKYFMAAITVPESDLWVNLSPYERNRIIPEGLGSTEMGRDLLAQDYLLKQLTASLIYPEEDLGHKFWENVYAKVHERFGSVDIPVDTFNKVWIVPDKAVVYEREGSAFVGERHLKVMMEEDYNAAFAARDQEELASASERRALSSQIIKEIIIPAIEKEVNTGANFARLRQIFNSMILATWYKRRLKESLLGKVYMNQDKIKGIDIEDKQMKQKIYEQYLEAFRKGVYNYIKEEYDPVAQEIIARKYFSGGIAADKINPQLEIRQLERTSLDAAMIVGPESSAGELKKEEVLLNPDNSDIFIERGPRSESSLVQKMKDRIRGMLQEKLYGHQAIDLQEQLTVKNILKGLKSEIPGEAQEAHVSGLVYACIVSEIMSIGGNIFFQQASEAIKALSEWLSHQKITEREAKEILVILAQEGLPLLPFSQMPLSPEDNKIPTPSFFRDTLVMLVGDLSSEDESRADDAMLSEGRWIYREELKEELKGLEGIRNLNTVLSEPEHMAFLMAAPGWGKKEYVDIFSHNKNVVRINARDLFYHKYIFPHYRWSLALFKAKFAKEAELREEEAQWIQENFKEVVSEILNRPENKRDLLVFDEFDAISNNGFSASEKKIAKEVVDVAAALRHRYKIIMVLHQSGGDVSSFWEYMGKTLLENSDGEKPIDVFYENLIKFKFLNEKDENRILKLTGFSEENQKAFKRLAQGLPVAYLSFFEYAASRLKKKASDDVVDLYFLTFDEFLEEAQNKIRKIFNLQEKTNHETALFLLKMARQEVGLEDPEVLARARELEATGLVNVIRDREHYRIVERVVIPELVVNTLAGNTEVTAHPNPVAKEYFESQELSIDIENGTRSYEEYGKGLLKRFHRKKRKRFETAFMDEFIEAIRSYYRSGKWFNYPSLDGSLRKNFKEINEEKYIGNSGALVNNGFYRSQEFYEKVIRPFFLIKDNDGEFVPINIDWNNVDWDRVNGARTPDDIKAMKAKVLMQDISEKIGKKYLKGQVSVGAFRIDLLRKRFFRFQTKYGVMILKKALPLVGSILLVLLSEYFHASPTDFLPENLFSLDWMQKVGLTQETVKLWFDIIRPAVSFVVYQFILNKIFKKFQIRLEKFQERFYRKPFKNYILSRKEEKRQNFKKEYYNVSQQVKNRLEFQNIQDMEIFDAVVEMIRQKYHSVEDSLQIAKMLKVLTREKDRVDSSIAIVAMLKEFAEDFPEAFDDQVNQWKKEAGVIKSRFMKVLQMEIIPSLKKHDSKESWRAIKSLFEKIGLQKRLRARRILQLVSYAQMQRMDVSLETLAQIKAGEKSNTDFDEKAAIDAEKTCLLNIANQKELGEYFHRQLIDVLEKPQFSPEERKTIVYSYFLVSGIGRLDLLLEHIREGRKMNKDFSQEYFYRLKLVVSDFWLPILERIRKRPQFYGLKPLEVDNLIETMDEYRKYIFYESNINGNPSSFRPIRDMEKEDLSEWAQDILKDQDFAALSSEADFQIPSDVNIISAGIDPTGRKGGIDLDAAKLDLEIRKDQNDIVVPVYDQSINPMMIEGFSPLIINITPITVPMILGQKNSWDDPGFKLSKVNKK